MMKLFSKKTEAIITIITALIFYFVPIMMGGLERVNTILFILITIGMAFIIICSIKQYKES